MPEKRGQLLMDAGEVKNGARVFEKEAEDRRKAGALQLPIKIKKADGKAVRNLTRLQVMLPALKEPGAIAVQHALHRVLGEEPGARTAFVFVRKIKQGEPQA